MVPWWPVRFPIAPAALGGLRKKSGKWKAESGNTEMEALIVPEVTEAVEREFRLGFQARAAMAAVRQERVNEASRALRAKLMDGIGQLTHRVDADFYWMAKLKYGAQCWSDPDFRDDCVRKGAIERVAGQSEKLMVSFAGADRRAMA